MTRASTVKAQLEDLQKRANATLATIEARENKEATTEELASLKEIRESLAKKKVELREIEELQSELTDLVKDSLPPSSTDGKEDRAGHKPGVIEPNLKKEPTFRSAGEQLQAIYLMDNPRVDQRGKEQSYNMLMEVQKRAPSGLNTMADPDGGYLIQPEFSAEILKNQFEVGQLAARCKKVPMLSNRLVMLAVKDENRADGSRLGGVVAYWVNEAEAAVKSKPGLRKIEMGLDKLMAIGYATAELLTDAPALGAIMLDGFGEEFAFMIDESVVWGSGTDQPFGILNSKYNGLLTISKESGQTDVLVPMNLSKMRAAMPSRYYKSCFWAINPEIRPNLDLLTLPVGTGGVPVFLPANNLTQDGFDTLYGRPIIPLEQCAGAKSKGDIMLLSMDAYMIGKKGEMQTDASMHVRFEYDETAFRCTQRIGGQPIPEKPITPKRSATGFKMSPFIALEAR